MTQPNQEHVDILAYVMKAFIPGHEPMMLHRHNVDQVATAFLTVLGMTGWSLSYDPDKLAETITRTAEGLPLVQGLPPRPPELLSE